MEAVAIYLRDVLREEGKRSSEDLPQELLDRHGLVGLTLRKSGKVVWDIWTRADHQKGALERAAQLCLEQLSLEVRRADFSLEITLAREIPRAIDNAVDDQWRTVDDPSVRTSLGLEFISGENWQRICPLSWVARGKSAEDLLHDFVERFQVPPERVRSELKIRRFNCDSFLTFSPPRESVPLVRGCRFVKEEALGYQSLQRFAGLWAGYLHRQFDPSGLVRENLSLIEPSKGAVSDEKEPSLIRQFLVSRALTTWWQAVAGRSQPNLDAGPSAQSISKVVLRQLQVLIKNYYENPATASSSQEKDPRPEGDLLGQFGVFRERGNSKLGAIALGRLALKAYPEALAFSEMEAALRRTEDVFWLASGKFRLNGEREDSAGQHHYYPGEALLSLAYRYEESPDLEIHQRYFSSFYYYRAFHLADRQPAFVPWHTLANVLMWKKTREPALARFVFEMNDWLIGFQDWGPTVPPELWGRFRHPRVSSLSQDASSVGAYLEGLSQAYVLAEQLMDASRQERYRLAVMRGLRYLMQLTVQSSEELYFSPRAIEGVGGVRTDFGDSKLKIDSAQFALKAALGVLEVFSPQEVTCRPDTFLLLEERASQEYKGLVCHEFRHTKGLGGGAHGECVIGRLECENSRILAIVRPEFSEFLKNALSPLQLTESACGEKIGGNSVFCDLFGALAMELLRLVDVESSFVCVSSTGTRDPSGAGSFEIVLESEVPVVAKDAIRLGVILVAAFERHRSGGHLGPVRRLISAYLREARTKTVEPMRRHMARAARRAGVPVRRVTSRPDIFQFGTGRYLRRWDITVTSGTSQVHALLTGRKELANPLQRAMGLPVPRQLSARSAVEAKNAARIIGFPVVVKPRTGSGGTGVSANLTSEQQVVQAFRSIVPRYGDQAVIEEFLSGEDYRFLYFGGKFVAACRRIPPQVHGNGLSTIRELVHEHNSKRQENTGGFDPSLHSLVLDDEAKLNLAAVLLDADAIPALGEVVRLSSAANGGTTEDVSDKVHPDNVAAGARAARVAGIDVCGIDFLLPDVSRSYRETGGGICEVNFQPSPLVHMIADGGLNLRVVDEFVRFLVPERSGRVPLVSILGLSADFLEELGRAIGPGVACIQEGGIFFEGNWVSDLADSLAESVRRCLDDTGSRVVLVQVQENDLAQSGLGADWCDLVVVGAPIDPQASASRALLGATSKVLTSSEARGSLPQELGEKVEGVEVSENGRLSLLRQAAIFLCEPVFDLGLDRKTMATTGVLVGPTG